MTISHLILLRATCTVLLNTTGGTASCIPWKYEGMQHLAPFTQGVVQDYLVNTHTYWWKQYRRVKGWKISLKLFLGAEHWNVPTISNAGPLRAIVARLPIEVEAVVPPVTGLLVSFGQDCEKNLLNETGPVLPTTRSCLGSSLRSTLPTACYHHHSHDWAGTSLSCNQTFWSGQICSSFLLLRKYLSFIPGPQVALQGGPLSTQGDQVPRKALAFFYVGLFTLIKPPTYQQEPVPHHWALSLG